MGMHRQGKAKFDIYEYNSPFKGMKIKRLKIDNSIWARIYYLNVSSDATYFTTEEVLKSHKGNRFSRLEIIDKFKTSHVKLKNLAPTINGISGFTSSSLATANNSEGFRKYTDASLQLSGTTQSEVTLQSAAATVPLINGHIYYARVEIKQSAKVGSGEMFLGGSTAGGGVAAPPIITSQSVSAANTWTTISGVAARTFPTGNHNIRLDFNNGGTTGNMCFDGLVIIDLTESFGSGYEPTKDWCDANIPYFIGTTMIDASNMSYQRYEFMLTYPSLSSSLYNRWTQIGSPNNTAPAGYNQITTTWNTHAGPLRKASGAAQYNCDNIGSTSWFAAIGQTSRWTETQAIPAADGSAQTQTELWVRIDNLSPANKVQIYEEDNLIANSFYEY